MRPWLERVFPASHRPSQRRPPKDPNRVGDQRLSALPPVARRLLRWFQHAPTRGVALVERLAMSQSPHAAPDTTGSPGLLGGALALGWLAIMSYGPLATWGAPQLLKQPPGFLVMLAAVAIFPALGLWILVGSWRTAWTANLRYDADADRLHAEIGDLRAAVASLTTLIDGQAQSAARLTTSERPSLDAARAPFAQPRLNVTSLKTTLKITPAAPPRQRRAKIVAAASTPPAPLQPASADPMSAKPGRATSRRRSTTAPAVALLAPEPPPIALMPSDANAPAPPPQVAATGGKRMKTSLDAHIDETAAPRRARRAVRAAG